MRRIFTGVVFILSIVLLTISIYFLMGMFRDYQAEKTVNNRLKDLYEEAHQTESDDPMSAADEDVSEEETEIVIDAGLLALHAENPDCIYWITIPDTVIDYPVMYRPQDKDYYLRRDFYGDYLASGTLYLEEACDPERGDNLIIYGHHMKSGSMFAVLDQYKSRDFYEEHPLIILQTLHGEEHYRVMAAFATPVYTGHDFAYYGFTATGNPTEYQAYVEACKTRSFYDTGLTAVYGQRLLTLSTCEYSQKNGRMVVVAVREDM